MKTIDWIVPTHYRPHLVAMVVQNLRELRMPDGWNSTITVMATEDDPCWDNQELANNICVTQSKLVGTKMDLGWRHGEGELVGICGDDDFLHPEHANEAIIAYGKGSPLSVVSAFDSIVVDKGKQARWISRVGFPPIGTGIVVSRKLLEAVNGWPRVVKGVDHRFRERVSKIVPDPNLLLSAPEVLTCSKSMSARADASMRDHDTNVGAWKVSACFESTLASRYVQIAVALAKEHGIEYLYGNG